MVFAITHEVSSGTSTDNTVFTTASITVAAGELVVAFVTSGTAAATTPLPTSLGGTLGLTWTMAGDVIMNSSSVGRTSAWWADAGAGATGTVTFNFGATQSNCQWTIVTITGADNADPIVQVDTLRTAGTNPSMTISPAPGASSMVVGAMHANLTTVPTAGAGWTIIGTGFSGASPALRQTVQYDLAAPGATFNYTLASATNKGLIALELREPTADIKQGSASGSVSWVGRAGTDLIADLSFPLVIAHRGGADEAPENTLTALTQTFAAHPGMIGEIDLRANQDGSLVLMHDTTVDRTAGAGETGLVSDYTDAEWASLTVAWPVPPGGTAVPASFWDEVRDAFPDQILMPEVSTSGAAASLAADVAADPSLTWRVIGQAFNKTNATTLANAGLRVVQLYGGATPDVAEDAANGMWAIGIEASDPDLTPTLIADAHALGLKVLAYTVNTTTLRDDLFADGVDGVFSDVPTALTDVAPSEGAASGSMSRAGAATGSVVKSGGATGSVLRVGAAIGQTIKSGAATGAVARGGSSTGQTVKRGATTGAVAYVGAATGEAPTVGGTSGSASGALAWTSAATGLTTRSGSLSGALAWSGVATGDTPSVGPVITPPERVYTVYADSRTDTAPADVRTAVVARESRTHAVPADNRTA